jgi:hypothetical protein
LALLVTKQRYHIAEWAFLLRDLADGN